MFQAWLVVALLWFVLMLNYLDRNMISTMKTSLNTDIPMTDVEFGMLMAIFLWIYGLLSPLAGFLSDRFGRSRIIIFSLIVWSMVTWLTAQAETYNQLWWARALMGISEACYIPAGLALIADYHRGSTRSLATGIHVTGATIGSLLAGNAAYFAEVQGWRFVFASCGIAGMLYGGLLWMFLRDAPQSLDQVRTISNEPSPDIFEAISSLFSRFSFFLLLAFWGLLGVAGWGVSHWMPSYLQEQFQLSQSAAGIAATYPHYSGSLIGMILGGVLADYWSRSHPRARILVPVVGLCIAVPGLLLTAASPILPPVLAGLFIYGVAKSFSDSNMMPILCMVVDPRYRATGYGFLNMCACLAGGTTAYIGGVMKDADVNVSYLFGFAAIGLLVCALLLFFVRPALQVNEESLN